MPRVTIQGAELEYDEIGHGRPLVLLHSLLADRSAFAHVAPLLAPGRRLLMVSLPGFAGSSAAEPSIEAYADRIAGLFGALDLAVETDVLGNGFGGFVAVALAIRHGGLFDRLVLADTGMAFSPEGRGAFHVMASKASEGGMPALVDIAIRRLFPEDYIQANLDTVARCREALLRTDPEMFARACQVLATLDLSGQVPGIRNSTLVMVGSLDAATPPAMSRALAAAIPGARFLELDGLGHAPHVQAPARFAGALSDFLAVPHPAADAKRAQA
ncbi:alpha/beta fold hydrolase [Rubellimicrobium roseum]|uniref:Alpha/beta fold hydrolase n=1 Tax=Rubellimicrobium roseum TaxID=687525 RepID=A0A5C4NE92_9RHOB|nr:alpha/beta fold hydrolase [Rubellimicrobium roseum]TNC72205.1 alpha/beta fold hydrolase [Rubellimicrobium roseum]